VNAPKDNNFFWIFIFTTITLLSSLDDGHFPKKRGYNFTLFFQKELSIYFDAYYENSMVHILCAPHKHGIVELVTNILA